MTKMEEKNCNCISTKNQSHNTGIFFIHGDNIKNCAKMLYKCVLELKMIRNSFFIYK